MTRSVLVLGSTGSVGRQSLEVLEELGDGWSVAGLSAATSAEELAAQAAATGAPRVCLADPAAAGTVAFPAGCEVLTGAEGLVELVERAAADVVVCAITGAAGLPSTLAAARSGAVVALANKESLVLAGHLVGAAAKASGATIVPVDSEHSAVFQCLAGSAPGHLRRIVLTASGGPFRGRDRASLEGVTVEQALRHPSWEMGPRITIDSATLLNKGLEIIEACHLFDVPPSMIDVVVHPQSVIHSMVEFVDGSMLAQLGPPDMRLPVRVALGWPDRLPTAAPPVDVLALSGLHFEAPDRDTFPCLALAERAARQGGLSGTILNAANEVAVEAFLGRRLSFLEIPERIEAALDRFDPGSDPDLQSILLTDRQVREDTAARLPQPTS